MRELDQIFEGQQAEAWIREIGPYGDNVRMAIINPVVIHVLQQFAVGPGKEPTSGPDTVIRRALAALDRVIDYKPGLDADRFAAWHRAAGGPEYSKLQNATLWDLGSGENYLGRWLESFGVQHVGIEPSKDLVEYARTRSPNALLVNQTIHEFCSQPCRADLPPPSLISIIGVLEHCADPEGTLQALSRYVHDNGYTSVPLLVATFDPDFYIADLPRSSTTDSVIFSYGGKRTLRVFDPAYWELLFVNNGFHVLEQAPVQLHFLPRPLGEYLVSLHAQLFPGADAIIPPRQGPFYFWLLLPRRQPDDLVPGAFTFGREGELTAERRTYASHAPIEVIGNIGAIIHSVEKGSATFREGKSANQEADATGFGMNFGIGIKFGQMELLQNYVSSRLLGTVFAAQNDTLLHSVPALQVKDHLATSTDLRDILFVSMLEHLRSIRFDRFISAKHVAAEHSSEVMKPGAAPFQRVRNFAAILLQKWADEVSVQGENRFRSRVLVIVNQDHIKTAIYQDTSRKSGDFLHFVRFFVQNGFIDCFSPCLIEKIDQQMEEGGYQDNISLIDDENVNSSDIFHVGFIAARYLDRHLDFSHSDPAVLLSDVGLKISAMLGCTKDIQQLDNSSAKTANRQTRRRMESIKSTICDGQPTKELMVTSFLEQLCDYLHFRSTADVENVDGLSRLIVLRDIWGIVASLLDDSRMVFGRVNPVRPINYIKQPEQRHRMIAYFSECIAYIGASCGFEDEATKRTTN